MVSDHQLYRVARNGWQKKKRGSTISEYTPHEIALIMEIALTHLPLPRKNSLKLSFNDQAKRLVTGMHGTLRKRHCFFCPDINRPNYPCVD